MSTALLDAVVKKNRVRLIPFMLALYVLAFLDRSNIGFAKQTYGNDSNFLIVFYVQIMPADFVMQLHRF
ncbi:hypothetical protein BHF06_18290 [Escherichia coli]|nr:hypothetical protein BHF06_18290 [Escherichia coli]